LESTNREPERDAHAGRIDSVISYICSHLDDDLTLDHLSRIAGCSKYHFHRLFNAHTGFGVVQFVRLTRLERASYQLAFAPARSVTQIALDAGFSAPESFSRAFKELRGQTPSEFRRSPRWGGSARGGRLPTPTRSNGMNPEIVTFETTRVAVLEHRGPPDTLLSSVARFIDWRRSCQDSPVQTSRTFGVPHDDPDAVPAADFRFDICGELRGPLQQNAAGIIEKAIPGGRCAVARHIGSTDAIGDTLRLLYGEWLPQSGEQLRDYPCFFHYIKRVPSVPVHEQVTDVYLPLC
jgi:AraC family transcriptional regulator